MKRLMKGLAALLLAGAMLVTVAGPVSALSDTGVLACWNNGCPTDENTK